MQWGYGGYLADDNEATVLITHAKMRSRSGIAYALDWKAEINGRIARQNRTDMLARAAELKAACQLENQDFMLKYGDGVDSEQGVTAASAHVGPYVGSGPHFNDGRPAGWSVFVHYRLAIQAIIPLAGVSGNPVVEFTDETSIANPQAAGGVIFIPIKTGTWDVQQPYPTGTTRLIQSGRVVYLTAQGPPADPVLPTNRHIDRDAITYLQPELRLAGRQPLFPTEYRYEFESATPFGA